jgi:hypothetical protein
LITLLFFNCEQPSSSSGGGGGGEDGGTAVTFVSAVQTGGTWGTADSTGLTLTFSVDPTTLTADNITLTGATKGALSGSGTTRSLTISSITVGNGETVSVAITNPSGYSISKSPRYAEVYKLYLLRDTGPAGGLIFYDKGSYSDGWRFLEAAPQSTEWTSKQWGKYGTMVNGTETAIGTGKNNTALILAVLNASPADSDRAAQLTDALSYGGYDDWFLPSKDELNEMCWVLHSRRWNGISTEDNPAYGTNRVGGFANDYYWSSSESSRNYACLQYFDNGINYSLDKNLSLRVRAVRAF